MPKVKEFFAMSDAVYRVHNTEEHQDLLYLWNKAGGGWTEIESARRTGFGVGPSGSLFSSFHANAYKKDNDVVVAFRGTYKKNPSDVLADLKILVGIAPNIAGDAYHLVRDIQRQFPYSRISMTGHSLGGGIAQLVGFWTRVPFVTFNAPGMAHVKALAHFNIFKPMQFLRTWRTPTSRDMTIGVNYRLGWDKVSMGFIHIGMVLTWLHELKEGEHFTVSLQQMLESDTATADTDPLLKYGQWNGYKSGVHYTWRWEGHVRSTYRNTLYGGKVNIIKNVLKQPGVRLEKGNIIYPKRNA